MSQVKFLADSTCQKSLNNLASFGILWGLGWVWFVCEIDYWIDDTANSASFSEGKWILLDEWWWIGIWRRIGKMRQKLWSGFKNLGLNSLCWLWNKNEALCSVTSCGCGYECVIDMDIQYVFIIYACKLIIIRLFIHIWSTMWRGFLSSMWVTSLSLLLYKF